MKKRWRISYHDPVAIAELARRAEIPAVVAQLLLSRGISDPFQAQRFLKPTLHALHSPESFPACEQAADLLWSAIQSQRRIAVYGDYDADGITATAILWKCLRLLGADVKYYVPNRLEEGYGLQSSTIEDLARQGVQLIVTVDCGITAVQEVAFAQEKGIPIIVTDHHEPGDDLPQAAALVHPRVGSSLFPFPWLSGAGVAFRLAWALIRRASSGRRAEDRLRDFLVQAVGLAAIGTVADIVPLWDENRVLVHYGCTVSLARQPSLGLAALQKFANQSRNGKTDSEWIAFQLAPRINAVGRLGQAALAVELLVTEKEDRAMELAAYLNSLNDQRKSLEQSIYLRALRQIKEHYDPDNDPAFVLADADWHQGVIGIVAGRLAEKFHRPVILISLSKTGSKLAVGSARSVPGFHLHQALTACAHHLERFGGHAQAAGLTIAEQNINSFRHEFCQYVADNFDREQNLAEISIDCEFPLGVFTVNVVEQVERLAPFGMGNPRPIMCCENVTLAESPRVVGQGQQHLSMRVQHSGTVMRAIAFGAGERVYELACGQPFDLAFRPVISEFNGSRRVELHVVDWRTPQERPR